MDFSTGTLYCKMSEASSEASSDDRDGLASLASWPASSPASSGGLRSLDISDADDAACNDDDDDDNDDAGPVPLVVCLPRTLYLG